MTRPPSTPITSIEIMHGSLGRMIGTPQDQLDGNVYFEYDGQRYQWCGQMGYEGITVFRIVPVKIEAN